MRERARWFPFLRPKRQAELRLVCLPHAGGGAGAFRAIATELPQSIECWAVQMPGRETRYGEPLARGLPELVDALAEACAGLHEQPYALIGHSLGALLGHELAQRFEQQGLPAPRVLIASACRAPQLPQVSRSLHTLTDAELVDALRELDGTPAAVLDQPDLLRLVLPVVRADLALRENYRWRECAPLSAPIAALGAEQDDLTPEQLEGWRLRTRADFRLRWLPGGHFALLRDPGAAAHAILDALGWAGWRPEARA